MLPLGTHLLCIARAFMQEFWQSDFLTITLSMLQQLFFGCNNFSSLQAFEYAMQVTTAGGARAVIPRLRDFQPALVGYALTGQAGKSQEVVRCMMEHCQPGDMTGRFLSRFLNLSGSLHPRAVLHVVALIWHCVACITPGRAPCLQPTRHPGAAVSAPCGKLVPTA